MNIIKFPGLKMNLDDLIFYLPVLDGHHTLRRHIQKWTVLTMIEDRSVHLQRQHKD